MKICSKGIKESKTKPGKSEKQAVGFVKQKLDSAKWFIDAIKQRQHTLTVTIHAIVRVSIGIFHKWR